MKNIKDIIIGIFAVIGVLALVTGFANNTETATQQVSYGTPESHVWEVKSAISNKLPVTYMYNKKTGEVRKLSGLALLSPSGSGKYRVMQNYKKEFIPKPKNNSIPLIKDISKKNNSIPLIKDISKKDKKNE